MTQQSITDLVTFSFKSDGTGAIGTCKDRVAMSAVHAYLRDTLKINSETRIIDESKPSQECRVIVGRNDIDTVRNAGFTFAPLEVGDSKRVVDIDYKGGEIAIPESFSAPTDAPLKPVIKSLGERIIGRTS